tara:strand:+ start:108 stop:899 length:792 start_codon:yes stop_codon:yes gene_type:complete
MSETKKCNMCKQILPIENFALCDKYGGRRGKCKPCQTEHKQRSKGTWERYQKKQAYTEELHLLQKEGKRRCRFCEEILPLEKFAVSSKGHHGRKSYCNPCAGEKWQKAYRQLPESRARKSIADKKYRSKPDVKERIHKQLNEKYHNDPAFKLKHLMRGRLNKVLDRKKQSKRFTQELGCTFDELVIHLESKFYPNPKTGEVMTWDNHTMDGWHVDHKKPLHEFDLYDDEQFKKAAHYTNLQPLWWWENLEKNRGIAYKKKGLT